jgi:tetratricopeptide (TPR) repeat protein
MMGGCERPVTAPQARRPTPTKQLEDSQTAEQVRIDPVELRTQAARELSAGDVESAYEHARAVMVVAPQDPQVVFLMARVLGSRQRFPEAIRMLDRLAESTPETRLPALGQTAEWMVLHGDWVGAEKRYRTLVEEVPGAVMAHRELSLLLLRQGRRVEAARHLREMCRQGNVEETELRTLLRVSFPFAADAIKQEREPIGSLGIARYQISQAQWDESIATLVESISPSPAESSLLGRIYAQRANVEGLAKWGSQWSQSGNQNADAWFALGIHKAISGHHESAVRCFCEVVIRDPTDVEAYSSMSRSLEILRAHAEAGEADKRSGLIRRTQLIGSEMAESDARDLNKISELVGLLDQLHRRVESLAWRAIQLAYGQSDLTAEQTRQRMTEINRSRLELLKTDTLDASESFIVCGVDLRSLRSKDDAVSKSEDAN